MAFYKNSISQFYLLDSPYYLFQTPYWVCQLSIFKKITPADSHESPSEKMKFSQLKEAGSRLDCFIKIKF